MAGKLYLVSTPIGNFRDITLRALDVLRSADAVICEEYRAGSTILKKLDVTAKDLILLNEHNEKDASPQIAQEILAGKTYALISDCGTPAFADPGTHLIRLCLQYGLRVVPVPGPSSLMAAISLSPLPLDEFYFVGFLPRKKEEREVRLGALKRLKVALVIMESPYRLERILQEVAETFGDGQLITLAFDLTLKGEEVFHNTVAMVREKVESKKGEFVLIVHRQ